jgi:hypothetical protein
MLFYFALVNIIRTVLGNEFSMELNGICQQFFYVYQINLLADSINNIKHNTETLLRACRNLGLEINSEKTKYMIMSFHQNLGQDHKIRKDN